MPWRRNSPPSSRSSPNCSQQLAAARKDSSTSSKPPSSDIVKPPKPPPPEGQDRAPHRRTTRTPQARACRLPARGGQRRIPRLSPRPLPRVRTRPATHLTIAPRVVQQVEIPEVPLSIAGASQSSGVVPPLPEDATRPRSRRRSNAAAWSGRPDHADRLPQGGLPRLLLDHPQVPPRCRAGDDLAGPTGQDHRQGQPGVGATL